MPNQITPEEHKRQIEAYVKEFPHYKIYADALHRVCDERARLLALLPATLPVEAQPLLDRFHAVRTANEAAAERTAAELRSQLSHLGAGRNALTAYAPMGPSISVDRSG